MKKYFYLSISIALAVLSVFIFNPVTFANAAEEIDAYCTAPTEAVAHGSTVPLTIKFSDSDKSNDFIAQGPFKVLQYKDTVPMIVDFKRANEKNDEKGGTGKENTDKPTLTFSVALSPKHKMPAPATEAVTLTYFVKHKEGKRGALHTTEREQQVDCSFTVLHEIEKGTTPSGANIKNWTPADLGIENVGTLPTSKWYFLKEWKRGVSRLFTFGATAKAELELEITNEKAAEVLALQETEVEGALEKAFGNYTDATERLRARLDNLEETSKNPNVEKLLKRLDEQTLKHALLLNQIAERWNNDPYVEDANVVNPQAARDNHLQGAVDVMQKNIREIAVLGVEKDTNIKEKAEAQIKRAEEAVLELKLRIDSTPARISTNMTIERQTPKRDFGDRMKAGLETAAGVLANAKTVYAEGKFGEAFGLARSAEVSAWGNLQMFTDKDMDGVMRPNEKAVAPPMPNVPTPVIAKPPVLNPSCGAIRCLRYQPVCGTDGKTYSCGEADASACGVKVAYESECKVEPSTEVKPIPGVACTQQYDPVCGIDGETYGNDCMARISGVNVAYDGKCRAEEMGGGTTGESSSATIQVSGSLNTTTR